MSKNTRIVQIGGQKLEVDMRTAKRVDTLRVGDPIKVLVTNDYSTPKHKVCHGIVAGFDPFEDKPTITVAYLDMGDGIFSPSTEIKIQAVNEDTKNIEIVPSIDAADVLIDKDAIVEKLDSEIKKAETDRLKAVEKKAYFLRHFGRWFGHTAEDVATQPELQPID